jgi:hypothetical protein
VYNAIPVWSFNLLRPDDDSDDWVTRLNPNTNT